MSFDIEEEEREQQVELLFDGQGPEVPSKVPGHDERPDLSVVEKVLIEEEGPEPEMPVLVDHAGEDKESDDGEVGEGRWLNAKQTPDVEVANAKAALALLVAQDTGAY